MSRKSRILLIIFMVACCWGSLQIYVFYATDFNSGETEKLKRDFPNDSLEEITYDSSINRTENVSSKLAKDIVDLELDTSKAVKLKKKQIKIQHSESKIKPTTNRPSTKSIVVEDSKPTRVESTHKSVVTNNITEIRKKIESPAAGNKSKGKKRAQSLYRKLKRRRKSGNKNNDLERARLLTLFRKTTTKTDNTTEPAETKESNQSNVEENLKLPEKQQKKPEEMSTSTAKIKVSHLDSKLSDKHDESVKEFSKNKTPSAFPSKEKVTDLAKKTLPDKKTPVETPNAENRQEQKTVKTVIKKKLLVKPKLKSHLRVNETNPAEEHVVSEVSTTRATKLDKGKTPDINVESEKIRTKEKHPKKDNRSNKLELTTKLTIKSTRLASTANIHSTTPSSKGGLTPTVKVNDQNMHINRTEIKKENMKITKVTSKLPESKTNKGKQDDNKTNLKEKKIQSEKELPDHTSRKPNPKFNLKSKQQSSRKPISTVTPEAAANSKLEEPEKISSKLTTKPAVKSNQEKTNKASVKPIQKINVQKNTEHSDVSMVKILDYNMRRMKFNVNDPGENGTDVYTNPLEYNKVQRGWKRASFNEYVSNKISLERAIPDRRHKLCLDKKYPYKSLPTVSVIMCFTEESPSTLMRSLYSVLNRTPPMLIEEILLVDDNSQRPDLGKDLEEKLSGLRKVRLIRLKERHGLVRARLVAVKQAKAPVLVFLDSHIECNIGWLEPLLEVIHTSKGESVASPLIDLINPDTFSYKPAQENVRGGFTWSLEFRWNPVSPKELKRRASPIDTVLTPAMAGGLFAIDKNFFNSLGGYDPGLEVWGSENLELSFKVWMCGGKLEIAPCSRVGHIFRATQPYRFLKHTNVETFLRNNIRVAEVWMDGYKDIFYSVFPKLRNIKPQNITGRLVQRAGMGCRNFQWYLDTVYPELHIPALNPVAGGGLKSMTGIFCMTKAPIPNQPVRMDICNGQGGHQHFQLTDDDTIETLDECLGVLQGDKVCAVNCNSKNVLLLEYSTPIWAEAINKKSDGFIGRTLVDKVSGKCVTATSNSAVLQICKRGQINQLWTFMQHFEETP